jgi:hypothetical protein
MTQVPMDERLSERLRAATTTVEVVDASGRVCGVYTPTRKHVPPPGYSVPFSDEELAELRKHKTGRPLADIMRDLQKKYGP